MKVAFSGMILGASMLSANAEEYTFAKLDGTQGGTITVDYTAGTITGGTCEAAPEHGTAFPGYALGASLADYEAETTLAFLCGIDDQQIDDAKGAPHVGDKILLKLEGTADADACAEERIRNPQDDTGAGESSSSSGGVVGDRLFRPEVTAKVLYKCILGKSHAGPSNVRAALRVKKNTDTVDQTIVSGFPAAVSMTLLRSGPKEFSATQTMEFDLGTNKPHSAYYTSTGRNEGCDGETDSDPCFGSISLSADSFYPKSITSTLSGEGAWDASDALVPYFGFDDAACSTAEQTPFPGISEFDACGMKKQETQGQGSTGLLTPFECPFNATLSSNGREANVDTCIAKGKALFISNACADGRTSKTNKKLSNTAFSVELSWSDAAYKSGPPAGDGLGMPSSSESNLPAGTKSWDWTINGITDVDEVRGLYVRGYVPPVSGNTGSYPFSQPVTVINGEVKVTNVPIEVTSLELRGSVLMTSPSCQYEDKQIGTSLSILAIAPSLPDGGEFKMLDDVDNVDPCDGRFKYSLGAGEDVKGIHAPGKDVTIRFCSGNESAAMCKAETRSATETAGFAVIEGACDNVHAGDVGALIEITGKSPAAVVCPGACKAVNLGKVKLDWSVDFALSLADGAGNRLLVEQEGGSDYAEENLGKTPSAHLASFNQCGVDGKVYGTAADFSPAIGSVDSCAVDFSSLTKASDFVELFQKCGATTSDSPSVYLISQFEVTLVDRSKLHFCNAKILSIQKEAMQGESTSSVGIVAEVANAADAMTAAFSFIGYSDDGCASGQYKLMATMDVETDATNVDITEDDGTFAQLENGSSSVGYSNGVLTFETVCADVCSVGGAYDEQYNLEVLLNGDNSAELHIDAQIEVDGTPCGESDKLERGSVELTLYGVDNSDKANTVTVCSSASPSGEQDDITPDNNDLCASINVTGMGSGTVSIVSEQLTRKSPGSNPEEISGSWFSATSYSNDVVHKSDGGRVLLAEDALTTFTLTIVWEQELSRRLLRSTHVFGAGDHEAKSSIFILPASAQIQDAVESLDAGSEGAEEPAEEPAEDAEPVAPSPEAEDSGLSGGEIAGIIAGGVVVVVGVAYAAVQAVRVNQQMGGGPQYSAVRRSERFSQMNF